VLRRLQRASTLTTCLPGVDVSLTIRLFEIGLRQTPLDGASLVLAEALLDRSVVGLIPSRTCVHERALLSRRPVPAAHSGQQPRDLFVPARQASISTSTRRVPVPGRFRRLFASIHSFVVTVFYFLDQAIDCTNKLEKRDTGTQGHTKRKKAAVLDL
jgi:hypothetical protein